MEDQASYAGLGASSSGNPADSSGIQIAALQEALGGNAALAATLGVSANQLSLWAYGREPVPRQIGKAIIDLARVVSQAKLLWGRKAVTEWFLGSNAYLDGSRPVDVLAAHRFSEVMDALEAAQYGVSG